MFPQWRADGKELYYIGPNGQMMGAPISTTAATGTPFEPGAPVALFDARIVGGGTDNGQGRQYDVTRDGRFLINTVLDDATSPITLLRTGNPRRAMHDGRRPISFAAGLPNPPLGCRVG